MNQHGADAVRWYMLAAGSPWSARRVGHDAISDVVRKSLLTYWNTVSFFTLYAKAADFQVTQLPTNPNLMDRWIISELNKLIAEVDKALEEFDSQQAGNLLGAFIDDLSNWYVRRSRRKFWDGESDALNTLYHCLKNLTLLLAPMVPFIAEHVWQELIKVAQNDQSESVHLANFPTSDATLIDEELSNSVALSRRLVELGRAARAESKVKIRQPLARALIAATGWEKMPSEIQSDIADELNILKIADISAAGADLVDISIKANFKSLGAKYGADVQAIASKISSLNAADLVKGLRVSQSAPITYELSGSSKTAILELADLVITETPKTGWSVASHNGESVALDLALTPDLINAGLVREAIRAIQEERKRLGLDISDRITVNWNAPTELANAINGAIAEISSEVLATEMKQFATEKTAENEIGLWLNLIKN
jgi:isoleucyl-tRNA synthetase